MPLLVADLGRHERFLNMMRVFKVRSPMSVGAWTLALFGAASAAAVATDRMRDRGTVPAMIPETASLIAGATGLVMATYTGVLLGVTAIPSWAENAGLLPVQFGASALGSAVSLLELRGHGEPALNALGFGVAGFETCAAVSIETNRSVASEPLREGTSGRLIRAGAILSGPVPLVLRAIGIRSKRARRLAAASTLIGSLLTRFAWVEAGKASARDPRVPLGIDRELP